MATAATGDRTGQGGRSPADAARAGGPEAPAGGGVDFDGLWDRGIAAFTRGDAATSRVFEALLRSRWLLEPAGHALSAMWRGQRLLRERQQEALRSQGFAASDDVLRAHAAVLRVEAQLEAQTAELTAIRADLAAMRAEKSGTASAPAPSVADISPSVATASGSDSPAATRPPRRHGKPSQE